MVGEESAARAWHEPTSPSPAPLGIVACAGSLPIEIADHALRTGRPVHVVAIEGFADPAVARFPHTWTNVGRIGALMAALRAAHCRDMVVAGALQRPDLGRIRIDLGTLRLLPALAGMTRGGDDQVLRRLVAFFEGQGFRVCGVQEVAPDLVAPPGPIAGPPAATLGLDAAIKRGGAVIGALGAFDIGQAVVASADRVLAIEAAEGTDGLLAALAQRGVAGTHGPAVLVKLPKPGQELRVDLPAIGPRTIDLAARAGLSGIAVAAGASLILERDRTAARARELGLAIAGIDAAPIHAEGLAAAARARADRLAPGAGNAVGWIAHGRIRPRQRGLAADLEMARRLIAVLAAIGGGQAAVVARERVYRIDAALGLGAVLAGLAVGRDWGLGVLRRRAGVLAIADMAVVPADPAGLAAMASRVAAVGLAGVAVVGPFELADGEADRIGRLAGLLGGHGLFLVSPAAKAPSS